MLGEQSLQGIDITQITLVLEQEQGLSTIGLLEELVLVLQIQEQDQRALHPLAPTEVLLGFIIGQNELMFLQLPEVLTQITKGIEEIPLLQTTILDHEIRRQDLHQVQIQIQEQHALTIILAEEHEIEQGKLR